jgi:glycerol-1-phosphate dehydrogenase [NAD(P)+]
MLKKRTIEIPKFIKIEPGIASSIKKILARYKLKYKKIITFTGPNNGFTHNLARKILEKPLLNNMICVEIEPRLKCRNSIYNVRKIEKNSLLKNADLLIGFGGCGVLDVVKHIAHVKGINYLSVATTASNDGISSPVSVIINEKRVPVSHFTKPALGIFIDLDILTKSRKETLQSGIGDLLSNASAIKDWDLAHNELNEEVDDFAKIISIASCNFVYDHIEEITNNPDLISSPEFIKNLVYGLVLSGLSMAVHGSSRPCSGAEHKFYHSFVRLYKKIHIPHGILVAVGIVYSEYLRNEDFLKYTKLFKALEIPFCSKQLKKAYGLEKKQVTKALAGSLKIRRGKRYTVFEHKKLNPKKAASIINEVDRVSSIN